MVGNETDFREHSDVLSARLQKHCRLASEKSKIDEVWVSTGRKGTFIRTVGGIVPDPLRQDINRGRVTLRECKLQNEGGDYHILTKLEVNDSGSSSTGRWDP